MLIALLGVWIPDKDLDHPQRAEGHFATSERILSISLRRRQIHGKRSNANERNKGQVNFQGYGDGSMAPGVLGIGTTAYVSAHNQVENLKH